MTPQPDDDAIAGAMIQYGGSFVRHLGELFRRADPANQAKLKSMFAEYWAKYAELVRMRAVREIKP